MILHGFPAQAEQQAALLVALDTTAVTSASQRASCAADMRLTSGRIANAGVSETQSLATKGHCGVSVGDGRIARWTADGRVTKSQQTLRSGVRCGSLATGVMTRAGG